MPESSRNLIAIPSGVQTANVTTAGPACLQANRLKADRHIPFPAANRRNGLYGRQVDPASRAEASAAGAQTPVHAKPGPDSNGQAGIADGSNVPFVQQVLRLSVDRQPGAQTVASAKVQLGVAMIQIAVGQQQAVAAVGIGVLQIGRVVAAAGKGRSENRAELPFRISCREKSRMRRAAEWPGAHEWRNSPNRNSVVSGSITAHHGLVIAIEGALHHGIEIGVSAAQE